MREKASTSTKTPEEAGSEEAAAPEQEPVAQKAVIVFQDNDQRIMLPAGIGPGYQQSCFAKRRLHRMGKMFLGEPFFGFISDGEDVPRVHEPWFVKEAIGDTVTAVQCSYFDISLMDLSSEYSLLGKVDSTVILDSEKPGYVHSIHSFNSRYIVKHWNQAEKVSASMIQLCEAAFLISNYFAKVLPVVTMNMIKKGDSAERNNFLSDLAFSGEDVPSISTFLKTVANWFDQNPFAWPMDGIDAFIQSRFVPIGMSTNIEDGLIIPLVQSVPILIWRMIVNADDAAYIDPFQALKKVPGAFEYYQEFYLPWRCGLDATVDHYDDFYRPGELYNRYKLWLSGADPTIISPSLFRSRLQEWRGDTNGTRISGKFKPFTTAPGYGYREKKSTPTYSALGGYNTKFITVRPSVIDTLEGMAEMDGQRMLVTKPEIDIVPGGRCNSQILDWVCHQLSNGYVYPSGVCQDFPLLANRWTDDVTPYGDSDMPTYHTDWLSVNYVADLFDLVEDIEKMVLNNPAVYEDVFRGRALRLPAFVDCFPNAVLMVDPVTPGTSDTGPYVPSKQRDLVASIISWMNLDRFVVNDRKTGKWLNSELP